MKKLILTLFCLLSLARGSSNAQCTALFSYYNSFPGDSIYTFIDSSSGTSGPVTYHWDFGDGSPINSSRNPQHVFSLVQGYRVCLSILDSAGCTNTTCDSVFTFLPATSVSVSLYQDSASLFNCTAPHSVNFVYYGNAFGYLTADSIKLEIRFGDGVDSIFYLSRVNTSFQGSLNHSYLNAGIYTSQLIVSGPDQRADTSISQTITVTASCGTISGTVYNDLNSNCTFDPGEELPNISLEIYNGIQLVGWASTDSNGLYSFNVPSGNTYDVHVNSSGGIGGHFTPSCPGSGILTISTIPSSGNNFGVACPPNFDLQGFVTGWGFRPGFTASVCVYVYNQNCNSPSGQIDITFPVNTTPLPDSIGSGYTINGNTVTYPISGPNLYWSFCIPVVVSQNAHIGDSVCIDMNITPTVGDADPSNNSGTFCFAVRNSYDPNDKSVTPAGEGVEGYIRPNTDLTYTIRFQNTGNADAINIYILDTLSANLNAASVEVIGSSHNVSYSLLTGNIMRFNFNNINLADSNSNEPASHGYVTYRVQQANIVAQLAQITNTAAIYFDFNPPIITNTTLNTVDQFLSVAKIKNLSSFINIYPNPSNQKCYLTFNGNHLKTISVSDMLGKEVFRILSAADSYILNTEKFAEGIYTVHLSDDHNQTVAGKLIISH